MAQNLILNPGFEDYSSCPTTIDQLSHADFWQRTTDGTPDYFNTCSTNGITGVPANAFGHQGAADGNAFAGIVTWVDPAYAASFTNYREYLSGTLSEPLEAGKEYNTGFQISRADLYKFGSSNIGIHFSDTVVALPQTGNNWLALSLNNIIPQFEYTGSPITDTTGWQTISGNFIANGGEQYLTLGNFRTDSLTSVALADPSLSNGMAYFFIDALFLERVYHPPIAVSDTVTLFENSTVTIPVLSNDYDTDGVLDPTSLELESTALHGLASLDVWTELMTYTPDTDYDGVDEVIYKVCDEEGLCDTAKVIFKILDVPLEPVMMNDSAAVEAGGVIILNPLANDLEGDYSLDPASLLLDPLPANINANIDPTTGSIEFSNVELQCNEYEFSYAACDDYGYCGSAQIKLEWTCAPPVAIDDYVQTNEQDALSITPLSNDYEGTATNDSWTLNLVGTPLYGLATWNETENILSYQPAESSAGNTDTFSYTICDGLGLCDRARIEVRISDLPDNPSTGIPDPIVVPQVFTPNSDGSNDQFVIENLADWPNNQLTVFNRWEKTVYTAGSYQNNWDGTLLETGRPLPNGTYYLILILDVNDPASLVYKGFTTIMR